MRPAILLLLLAGALAAQPASVDGVVVDRTTGQPLSGVHVRLFTGEIGNGGLDQAYGSISDKAGNYSVAGINPGLYVVMLERTGYFQVQPAGAIPLATIPLKAGQNLTGHKLEMTPRAMILGRVVDENGDPVKNASIELRPVPPDHEVVALFGSFGADTDERGEFRLLTPPGRFFVRATPQQWEEQGVGLEIRADGSVPVVYTPTFYPSAADEKSASVVQAGPGEDVPGIEIHLMHRAASSVRAVTVSGQVTGAPEGASAMVVLRYGERQDQLMNSQTTAAASDGKFTIPGLHPGFYRAFAKYSAGKVSLQSQSVDFQLDSSDQTNLQLTLRPGEELTGTLELAGSASSAVSAEKRSVRLEPADTDFFGDAAHASAETGKSGAFHFAGIHPGRYRVAVDPMPDNAFIKSVSLDNAEVPDAVLDFSRGVAGSRLKVAVSLNGAQISGKVLGHDGEPLQSPFALIMVWKDDKQAESDNSNRVTDSQYSVKALRPGKYRLAVVDTLDLGDLDSGDWDATLKLIRDAARVIEVKEGGRIVQDLKAISKEDLNGKPKQ